MKTSTPLFLFFFLPSFSLLTHAYSLYPGECMRFATEVSTYNFCIPANASANETFTFKYQILVHKKTVGGGTKYIPQPIYYENTTKIEELNETINQLNKTLLEKEEDVEKLLNYTNYLLALNKQKYEQIQNLTRTIDVYERKITAVMDILERERKIMERERELWIFVSTILFTIIIATSIIILKYKAKKPTNNF